MRARWRWLRQVARGAADLAGSARAGPGALLAVAAVAATAAAGCASDLTWIEAGMEPGLGAHYHHREHGYRIRDPAASGGREWQRMEVEGADLAFRARDGRSTMTLIAECGGKPVDPMILARHLVIGVRERDLRQAGPAVVDGIPAWSQTFDARADGVALRVKSITATTPACSYDWVLVTSADFERVERDFDAWWLSFRDRPRRAELPASDTAMDRSPGASPGPGEGQE